MWTGVFFAGVSLCTLVFVGSVDREACRILFAQGLKKHMAVARERCDMSLLKATRPARRQPCSHDSAEHINTLFNNMAAFKFHKVLFVSFFCLIFKSL